MILKAFCTVLGKFEFSASSQEGADWLGTLEASEVVPGHCYQLRISCESSDVVKMGESLEKSHGHREFLFNLFQNAKGELELHWFDNLGRSFKMAQNSLKSTSAESHSYVFQGEKTVVEFRVHDAQCFELVIQCGELGLVGVCQRRMLSGFIPRLVA
jgi:hypothetical protein